MRPRLVPYTECAQSQVESRFTSEESRTHHFLSSQTISPLTQILENNLITPHLSTIINMPSGLDAMIDLDRYEDLARMYRLFIMVPPGLQTLRKALRGSIIRRGQDINANNLTARVGDAMDEDEPDEASKGKGKARAPGAAALTLSLALKWVQDVLDMKDRFDKMWGLSFQNDRELESGINEVRRCCLLKIQELSVWLQAFESFVNLQQKAPEFISLFIDDHLKKGLKGVSHSPVFS